MKQSDEGRRQPDERLRSVIMIPPIVIGILLLLAAANPAFAAADQTEQVLPAQSCAEGWHMDGKVMLFDKDSLFDRINGESELYFPYGFEKLAYARYENSKDRKVAIDADVYAMGSLLDAFGMFANYRRKDAADAGIGAEGTVTQSQLLFYQDRYLVRLQVTGATTIDQAVLCACAGVIAKNLPQGSGRPKELDSLAVPAVVKKSERYIAQSLLGYEFFRRGLIADALLNKEPAQVFVVLERSDAAARAAFDQYRASVTVLGGAVRVADEKVRVALEAADPLYGTVLLEQSGDVLIGVARIKDRTAAHRLIEQVRARLRTR
jgi:hypothetical protein